MYKKTTVCAKWYIPCIFSFVKTVCKMQNIVIRPFFVYGGCCLFVGTAARRITNKKVGKQKFCIENLLPDFNF